MPRFSRHHRLVGAGMLLCLAAFGCDRFPAAMPHAIPLRSVLLRVYWKGDGPNVWRTMSIGDPEWFWDSTTVRVEKGSRVWPMLGQPRPAWDAPWAEPLRVARIVDADSLELLESPELSTVDSARSIRRIDGSAGVGLRRRIFSFRGSWNPGYWVAIRIVRDEAHPTARATGQVSGRVALWKPVRRFPSGWMVLLLDSKRYAWVDSSGAFAIDSVPAGPARLALWISWQDRRVVSITSPTDTVVIRLTPDDFPHPANTGPAIPIPPP